MNENREAFSRILFRPRVLIDKMAHPEREHATPRASSAAETIMILSLWATSGVEEVASTGPGIYFFQLYVDKDRSVVAQLVKNLSDSFTERDLINVFMECGPISGLVVMKDEMGRSKCFGFVNFVYAQHAFNAIEKFNGHQYNDKIWYVRRVHSKLERATELKTNYEQMSTRRFQEQWGLNLYLKNLDATFDTDDKLRELFSLFGTITSAKVVVDAKGQSKGYGYVAFSTRDEANHALNEINRKMIQGRPLYVAIFETKAQRLARLQGHFAQFTVPQVMAHVFPYTTGYTTTPLVNQNYMVTDYIQWQ